VAPCSGDPPPDLARRRIASIAITPPIEVVAGSSVDQQPEREGVIARDAEAFGDPTTVSSKSRRTRPDGTIVTRRRRS
jgi:hypothetical protein